jgi:hypothetical protein
MERTIVENINYFPNPTLNHRKRMLNILKMSQWRDDIILIKIYILRTELIR